MTVFLPLEASTPMPHSPSFLVEPTDARAQISKVIKAIMKAKRIVVICGAGISVQAGIPDFRSPDGLFKTLKRDNPREALATGKDLFDASVFNSEHTTSLFCQMIAQLSGLSKAAEPTAFHQVLRALDDRGKLLRVYTQNIDAIEQKCGLSFGVPEFDDKRCKSRTRGADLSADEPSTSEQRSPSKFLCVPGEPPRCIPLHGTLQLLHCQICTHSFPLEDHLSSLTLGQPPQCPECTSMEETRQLIGKRARGIGRLRPSVVLYNEAHKDGEGVGEAVRKDLIGSYKGKGRSGADLLLVVGTSLRVQGTKRMVREFAKAVRSRGASSPTLISGLPSPASSPRRSPASEEESSIKSVYINLDFPAPTREWEGVFDAWLQGDAQLFADMLQDEIEREAKVKELVTEKKKRKRDEEITSSAERQKATEEHEKARQELKQAKFKTRPPSSSRPAKRRKISLPPSPPRTPVTTNSKMTASRRPISRLQSPHSPKLVLRIPARRQRPYLIPEVYITAPPPLSASVRKSTFGQGQPPISPGKSPPRPNLATKAGRRAARIARLARPAREKAIRTTIDSTTSSSENDDGEETHILPESFVRTVQYGLRGSGAQAS